MTEIAARPELVDHPAHYQGQGIEVIDVIDRYDLRFALGNAIKYMLRAGKKGDPLTDLAKARWYLAHNAKLGFVPVETDEALVWHTPDEIVAAFGLTGDLAAAVEQVLDAAVFSGEEESLAAAAAALDRAIAALAPQEDNP